MSKKKKLKIASAVIVILFLLFGISAFLYPSYSPMEDVDAALQSDDEITVSMEDWISFTPTNASSGLIFYPGGKVPAEAYAPLAREIAKLGVMVILVPMPADLAFFGKNRAADVMEAHTSITTWMLGGHSIGGSTALSYYTSNTDLFSVLVLLATIPSKDISDHTIPCISIYGTLDGVLGWLDFPSSVNKLPINTTMVAISGGNHANFGNYGDQPFDNPSTITRQEQQNQTIAALHTFLLNLGIR